MLFFDPLRVRIRDEGTVCNKPVHLALGIRADGTKEVLGVWTERTEGARFWLRVMSELKARGERDCLIAVVDGRKGFPQAIRAVFPETQVQTCIVHLMRHALSLCSFKGRRDLAGDMREIYRAGSAEASADRLDRDRAAVRVRSRDPAPDGPTNAIESLNRSWRKSLKTRGHFPSDKAASKVLYPAIRNVEKRWNTPVAGWRQALYQLVVLFGDRLRGVS